MRMSAFGRYCCKSLFALRIKNSAGCGCDFHVKMWGTSSPGDKLMGDLGNVIEVTQIGGRREDRLMARKLSSSNFGLLQQYLPKADKCTAADGISIRSPVGRRRGVVRRIRGTERYGMSGRPVPHHSGLMPADLITLAHFSISSAISVPKSLGDPGRTVPV